MRNDYARFRYQGAPVELANQREQDTDIALIQQPRNVTHSQIFWFNMAVPFTGVASELISAYTEPEGFDSVVRGGWSDATVARARIIESRSEREWSSVYIPTRAQFGNSSEVAPLFYWGTPVLLEARDQLRADWINSNSEPARTACFYAEIIGNDKHVGDRQIRVRRSQSFWLQFDLSRTTSTTSPVNSDVLIWGAVTNAETSAITGRIFNESTNYAWSSQAIPLHAMAGVDGQVQPVMRYHRPYLLPANVKMRAEINTAITGQYFTFLCERILQ